LLRTVRPLACYSHDDRGIHSEGWLSRPEFHYFRRFGLTQSLLPVPYPER
jgi:hypothetical protein